VIRFQLPVQLIKEERMRVLAACVIAFGLIASPAMAGASGAGANGEPASPAGSDSSAKATSPAPAKPDNSTTESDLQQLKELIEAQSKQLQDQAQQLKEQQREMQSLEQQIRGSDSTANTLAATPVANAAVIAPVIGVASTSAAITAPSPPAAPQANNDQPTAIRYRGITLTPGGFAAAETVWRQKAMGSDVNTPFNSVPFSGSSQAHISEFNASGRQSRIAMLMQGKLANVTIGSFYEGDFLSAGATSNNNQSNSYTFRQRQFWGQAAFTNGFTLTGGQMWSLLTETTNGMDNRSENLPQTIDAQYHVGFSWARQYGFRFVKNFNNKVWLGASVEASQATVTVHGQPTVNNGGTTVCTNAGCTTTAVINPTVNNNFLLGVFGTGGGLYNVLANYAFNPAPDFIVKAVLQPGWGHYEVFGVVSQFHDRVFPCVPITGAVAPAGCPSATSAVGAFDDSRMGGGAGVNGRWFVMAKKVEFGVHLMGGNGIGRYGSVGLPDATTRPDGTLALLRNYQGLGTLQLHPVPKFDINLNVGGEYSARAQYAKTAGGAFNEGYGALGFNNSGCGTETLPVNAPVTTVPTGVGGTAGFIPGSLGGCTGDTRNVVEGSIGFWYRLYNGPMGRTQVGMQFSSYVRNTWDGNNAGATANIAPHAGQNMWFTSFRYYLP
jgi:hypothetical protein